MTDSVDPKVEAYFELAKQALEAGNHDEAEKFFTKVLEIDPANPEAWFGKGEAAGRGSSLYKMRLLEMGSCIAKAVKFSLPEKRDEACIRGATALHNMAQSAFSAAWNFYNSNMSSETGTVFWDAMDNILGALTAAHEINPKSIKVMEAIIILAGNAAPVILGGKSEQKSRAKALKAKFEQEIKVVDPNHTIPTSTCFVVTATMGNESNIFVHGLREFRDDVLADNSLGRRFISWYYKNGPRFAKVISMSLWFRVSAFVAIVLPSFVVASAITFLRKK